MTQQCDAVFFDLDGTLLDTAPDLTAAINHVLTLNKKRTIHSDQIRHLILGGTESIIKRAFNLNKNSPKYQRLKEQFLSYYAENSTTLTCFFPGIVEVLQFLQSHNIPWGVITNKSTQLTLPILKHFELDRSANCIICGDTLTRCKPHPDQLLHACELTDHTPSHCVYVGDTESDAIAAQAAGMQIISALYGYRREKTDPNDWPGTMKAQTTTDIISFLKDMISTSIPN